MIPIPQSRTEIKLHESSDGLGDSDAGDVTGKVKNRPFVASPGPIGIDDDSEKSFRDGQRR